MTIIKAALIVQYCPAGSFSGNIATTLELAEQASELGAGFIVFPEMNLTGYTAGKKIHDICRPVDTELIDLFSDFSRTRDVTLMVGLAEKTAQSDIYASHLIFDATGHIGTYRKIHTAPFEKKYFSAGDRIPVFHVNGLTFGIQLCYDSHFPELTLAMANQNADIIFLPHASPRGTADKKLQSWSRHLTARAFDNSLYIAACNQVGENQAGLSFPGISLFIGPDGNLISSSTKDLPSIHMIEIDRDALRAYRSHKMRYFLPNRRKDLFPL